jgi:hypothetical protein
MLGVWHGRVARGPPLHRQQRVQGAPRPANADAISRSFRLQCRSHLLSPFFSFRFLRTAPRTKRSSLATKSLPTTDAKAACPASCGTGLKPLALLQTCVTSTLRDLVTKHLHAWIISSTPAPSAGVARTSTSLHPPRPPPVSFSCRYRVKKGSTTHFTTVDAIQAAVYADGSVSASFNVYVSQASCACCTS